MGSLASGAMHTHSHVTQHPPMTMQLSRLACLHVMTASIVRLLHKLAVSWLCAVMCHQPSHQALVVVPCR